MAATTYAFSSQSNPVVEGRPHGMPDPNFDQIDAFKQVIATAIVEARKLLETDMTSDPAWAPYLGMVVVHWDEGLTYSFQGTPEQIEAMKLVEYGNGAEAPASPLMAKSMFRLKGRVEQDLNKTLERALQLG